MRPVKVASNSLYETSAVSLFAGLPTPPLLAARGIAARTSRLLVLRSSPRFSRKRETACSLQKDQLMSP